MSAADFDHVPTVEKWFQEGTRVHFDPSNRSIVSDEKLGTITVFERVRLPRYSKGLPNRDTRWLTLLPGFPVGSFGYAKVDKLIEQRKNISTPRLYIEYVGLGDSDKPNNGCYRYSTMERADLVEAQWRSHAVRKTVVVAFDYSSLVLMELMRRQLEDPFFPTKIEHVLFVNGCLFTDGHMHPCTSTLRSPFGRVSSTMAQHSNLVLDNLLKPFCSRSYRNGGNRTHYRRELREIEKAIRRRHGTQVLSEAAGFVHEHQKYSDRWDLHNILVEWNEQLCTEISVYLLGSEDDAFDHHQIDLAQKHLGDLHPQVQMERIACGHWSTAEMALEVTVLIEALTAKLAKS